MEKKLEKSLQSCQDLCQLQVQIKSPYSVFALVAIHWTIWSIPFCYELSHELSPIVGGKSRTNQTLVTSNQSGTLGSDVPLHPVPLTLSTQKGEKKGGGTAV